MVKIGKNDMSLLVDALKKARDEEVIPKIIEKAECERRKNLELVADLEPDISTMSLEAPVYSIDTAIIEAQTNEEEGFTAEEAANHASAFVEGIPYEVALRVTQEFLKGKSEIENTQLDVGRLNRISIHVDRYKQIEDLTKEPVVHRIVPEFWRGNAIKRYVALKTGELWKRMSLDQFLECVTDVHKVISDRTGGCKFDYKVSLAKGVDVKNRDRIEFCTKYEFTNREEIMELLEKYHRGPITRYRAEITLENELVRATITNLTPYSAIPIGKLPIKKLKGKRLELPKAQDGEVRKWAAGLGAAALSLGIFSAAGLLVGAAGLGASAYTTFEWMRGHSIGALTQVKPTDDTEHQYSERDVRDIALTMEDLRERRITYVNQNKQPFLP
jgi:hypothetical protein